MNDENHLVTGNLLLSTIKIQLLFFLNKIFVGEIADVSGTKFDFSKLTKISDKTPTNPNGPFGYDNDIIFIDSPPIDDKLRQLSRFCNLIILQTNLFRIVSPVSGIELQLWSTYPSVRFYTADNLDNQMGKDGNVYGQCCAFAIEAQCLSDAINHVRKINQISIEYLSI